MGRSSPQLQQSNPRLQVSVTQRGRKWTFVWIGLLIVIATGLLLLAIVLSILLAARELAKTRPTIRQVADFVFNRMPRGTPGMDGPEDYLTVDWETVRAAVCE